MTKKPSEDMPEIVFLGPKHHKVKHKLVVLKIDEKDENGVPRKMSVILDHETVDIDAGMEFMTAYIQAQMLRPEEKT